jgi:hypothetical protein
MKDEGKTFSSWRGGETVFEHPAFWPLSQGSTLGNPGVSATLRLQVGSHVEMTDAGLRPHIAEDTSTSRVETLSVWQNASDK